MADLDLPDAVFLDPATPISQAIKLFQQHGFAQFPVRNKLDRKSPILGILTKSELTKQLVKKRVTETDPISRVTSKELRHVSMRISLNELSRVLDRNKFALVERTKFVTSSDLISKLERELLDGEAKHERNGKATASGQSTFTRMATATAIGMGIGAMASLLWLK